jgi:multidrug efflux system outer membrane protein
MNKLYIFILIVFVFLSACMVGPKYKRPEVDKPIAYQELLDSATIINDSINDVSWFSLFNDSTLVLLIKEGLDSNLDIQRTAKRIEEARSVYGFTKADLFPSFSYKGSVSALNLSNQSTLPIDGTIDRYSLQGNMSWEIDLWGKLRHSKNAAYMDMFSYMEYERGLKLSLISEIANAYFTLLDLDNRMRITDSTIKSRTEYFKIISSRFEYGDIAEIDKFQSEQQLEIAFATQQQIIRSLKQTERALCLLLGKKPLSIQRGNVLVDQTVVPVIPDSLPSSLLSQRPDLRVAECQLKSQNERIGVAVAMRYPSLQITGMLGLVSGDVSTLLTADAFTNSISANLLGPIFSFGKNKRRVQIEKHKYEQLALSYEQSFIKALIDVNNSLTAVSTYKKELEHRTKQLEAARKVLELSKARYNSGITSYLEVLISEQNMFGAELEASSLRRAYLNSYVDVYKSFGGGW